MKKILLGLAGLLLASLACALPGGLGGGPLLQDDFEGFDQTWGTGSDSDSSVEYVNGGLNFQIFTPYYFVWSMPNDEDYSNVHIDVTVNNSSTDPNATFGIICNEGIPDTNKYYFAVTVNGQYAIARAAVAQDDFFLTGNNNWENSDLIPVNAASYQIGVDCGVGVLTLYVNGQQVASVNDTTYSSGGAGVFAWSDEKNSGVNVTFDDFVVTQLK